MEFSARVLTAVVSGFLLLGGCSRSYTVSRTSATLYPVAKDSPVDSAILSFYKPYKSAIDSQINAVVAVADIEITRKRPEGLLNNLVADAMTEAARAENLPFDFVHSNYKALRIPIPAGKIRAFQVFEMMPFENYLVAVKLKGPDALELFNYMASLGGDPIAGANFKIKNGKAYDIVINGKVFDINNTYTVLTTDYMANAGDKAEVYRKAFDRKDSSVKLRDAILLYLNRRTAEGKTIHPQIEGRIISDKPVGDE